MVIALTTITTAETTEYDSTPSTALPYLKGEILQTKDIVLSGILQTRLHPENVQLPRLTCGSGGTGRRASLRSLWASARGGSNPPFRTN